MHVSFKINHLRISEAALQIAKNVLWIIKNDASFGFVSRSRHCFFYFKSIPLFNF